MVLHFSGAARYLLFVGLMIGMLLKLFLVFLTCVRSTSFNLLLTNGKRVLSHPTKLF
jgi:hypothetical protein